ncbi:MAG: cupin domain-containing protein [Planctomycetota bacterium]|nr:cupin domain-containing protein [Planctomycetota bacterium]
MTIADAASLLAPISIDEFVERFLEREVRHLERNDPLVVDGIFDLESMGRCLRYGRPHLTDAMRVVAPDGGGEVTPAMLAAARMDPESGIAAMRSAFAERHTLIFSHAESYWPAVERIVMDLRRVLRSNVRCNVYCTPPASQGFDTHVDAHDVLVLQTSGSKTWRLHEVEHDLPVESSPLASEMFPRLASALPDHGEPTREVVLRPGDVLYLPRGVPHSAASTDEHSVHLTIGLYPLRVHELLARITDLVAFQSIDLRRRTPLEFYTDGSTAPTAGDLLRRAAELADACDPPIDLGRLLQADEEGWSGPPDPSGSFASALAAGNVDLDTVLERPEGRRWTTRRTEGEFRISCGARMSLPLKLEPVLGFFERHERFRVGEMPALLSENAKLTLARNLLKAGVLRVSDRPAPTIEQAAAPSPDLSWLQPGIPGVTPNG